MTNAIQEATNTAYEPEKLDPPGATSENQAFIPDVEEEQQEESKPEKLTPRDAVAKAFDQAAKGKGDKAEADGDEDADKDEPLEGKDQEAKPDKEKPVKAEKADKEIAAEKPDKSEQVAKEKVEARSEGRKIIEAPARFLPRARELWQNVPHPVREEWMRVEQEREQEVAQ